MQHRSVFVRWNHSRSSLILSVKSRELDAISHILPTEETPVTICAAVITHCAVRYFFIYHAKKLKSPSHAHMCVYVLLH